MERTVIQIARIRLGDVRVGDVVSPHADADHGWFDVAQVRELPSGDLVVTGTTNAYNVKGGPCDLVGLQVLKVVDVPDDRDLGLRPAAVTAGR